MNPRVTVNVCGELEPDAAVTFITSESMTIGTGKSAVAVVNNAPVEVTEIEVTELLMLEVRVSSP
ncbi:hypothetical protein, partial [Streptococcus pseudopneumoniae]|uniref:hypothetical protein n=1 Tax=Streptococcus pseudopneumoniae TaxID=257758 RepID=UPI0019D55632